MFLGGIGIGSPEPGRGDVPEHDKLARIEKKLDRLAQPEPGQGDVAHAEINAAGGAEITKDFGQFNPVKGGEYGSSKPTGDQEKQMIEDTAANREALQDIRDQIAKMPGGKEDHAKAGENIFDIAA